MTPEFKSWLASDSRRCLLAEVGVSVGGAETTRYLSTAGWVSGIADFPANTHYVPRVVGGFSFSQSLDINGSGGTTSYGSLQLDNTDGALDTWLKDVWAMRAIKLYLGQPDWAKSQFVLVFDGTVEDIEADSRGKVSLRLRDALAILDNPISTLKVGGTGDNSETNVPLALGECFNVEPVLLSESGLATYRVSLGGVEQIVEVRDNGHPVAVTKNAAAGTFTLQYARWAQITCDVQGAVSGEYRRDVGGLVEWIATTLGDGDRLPAGSVDSASLASFRANNAQPVGLYLRGGERKLDVIQQLSASLGATVLATREGKLKLVKLAYSAPTISISQKDMVVDSFNPIRRPWVRGAIKLSGCQNWTPQDKSALAAALEPNQVSILSEPTTVREVTNPAVISQYKQTGAVDEDETLLVVEADIQQEAQRRLDLWSEPRFVFRFEGFGDLMDIEVGQTVTITHERLGLSSGALAIVTAVDYDFIALRVSIEVLV